MNKRREWLQKNYVRAYVLTLFAGAAVGMVALLSLGISSISAVYLAFIPIFTLDMLVFKTPKWLAPAILLLAGMLLGSLYLESVNLFWSALLSVLALLSLSGLVLIKPGWTQKENWR
jgi:hypothetical protein